MRSRLMIAFVFRKRIQIISMKSRNKKNLIEIHIILQFFI